MTEKTVRRPSYVPVSQDEAFRRMNTVLVRKERARLIRSGRLLTAYDAQPQFLVRNPDAKGGWSPYIGEFM